MPNWSDRIDAAASALKARVARERTPQQGDTPDDAAALAHATSELERDLAGVLRQVESLASRGAEFEQRAMQAIRDGDDVGAREALLAHRECADGLERLEADATLLRASIADCHAVQAEHKQNAKDA